MSKDIWSMLQLFAGEGADGGEGSATGVPASDPSEARLRDLGVPQSILDKRARRSARRAPKAAAAAAQPEAPRQNTQAAAAVEEPKEEPAQEAQAPAEPPREEKPQEAQARMSWKEIMEDPEYNREMQNVIRSRLKRNGEAEATMEVLAPALAVIARKYGMDPAKLDHKALADAVAGDDSYLEDYAISQGSSPEQIRKEEAANASIRRQNREQMEAIQQQMDQLEVQKHRQHFAKLEQQGEVMKDRFPGFDLRQELKNPAFARMTHPDVGVPLETAYYAIHHREIQEATARAAQQEAAQKLANAVQSGSHRPVENGASAQAPSVTAFDYSKASKAERDALKRRILEAKARGEKIYPGR